MKPNVDIDRISLEDRVAALESRLPSSGAGLNSSFYIDPTVVDQCKDNAVTDVGNGLIIKISFDDVGSFQAAPSGGVKNHKDFGLKAAVFMPKINGVRHFMSSTLMRFTVLRASTMVSPPPNLSSILDFPFDASSAERLLFDHLQITDRSTVRTIYLWNALQVMPFQSAQGALSRSAHFHQFQGYLLFRQQGGVSLCLFTSIPASQPPTSYPCHCFGTAKYALSPFNSNATPGGGTHGGWVGSIQQQSIYGGYAVAAPQDLPAELKPIYPPSWYA